MQARGWTRCSRSRPRTAPPRCCGIPGLRRRFSFPVAGGGGGDGRAEPDAEAAALYCTAVSWPVGDGDYGGDGDSSDGGEEEDDDGDEDDDDGRNDIPEGPIVEEGCQRMRGRLCRVGDFNSGGGGPAAAVHVGV